MIILMDFESIYIYLYILTLFNKIIIGESGIVIKFKGAGIFIIEL